MRCVLELVGILCDDALYVGLTLVAFAGFRDIAAMLHEPFPSAGILGLLFVAIWVVTRILLNAMEGTD